MSPNFELIAAILGDYHDLQADGIVEAANRFPLGAVEEQIQLLSQFEAASNATLANQIAELERDVSMHRNTEIMWEKTMMAAVGEDGPSDVLKAIDKIKAERDALSSMLIVLRNAYDIFRETGLTDVLDDAFNKSTPERCFRELKAQTIEGAADHFTESGEASVTELQEYAETIRQGGAA